MGKLELDIEEEACRKALLLGVVSKKIKAAGDVGWPDRMFLIPGGKPLFIEFKQPGEKPRKTQLIIIRRLRYYGYEVEVCDTVQGALKEINKRLEPTRLPEKSR